MSFPVVPLESIPAHGLHAQLGDWARAAAAEGLGGDITAVSGELDLRRTRKHVAVQGALEASATVPCDRCGEPLGLVVGGQLSVLYSPVDAVPVADEDADRSGPALPEDLPVAVEEVGEYDGVALDLRDVVREYFAVERPPRFRCADADPGQDGACNARWRDRAGAPDPAVSSPFAGLKVLKTPR